MMVGTLERAAKTFASFFIGPILCIAVEDEMMEAARKEVFGDQLRGMSVVLENASKLELGPAKTEIHRGLTCMDDKVRQVIARPQPGENPVALPSPGDDFFAREVGRQMPMMFESKFFYAAMQS